MGIETYPDGTRKKGLFAEGIFLKSFDFNETLLD